MSAGRDITHIAGDRDHGISVTHRLNKAAHAEVALVYSGRYSAPFSNLEIVCEVYKAGDVFSVHSICPRCRNAVWIDGRNKRVDYDPQRGLFVEAHTCPWEIGDTDARKNDRQEFGLGLCGTRMVYDGKVAREA